MKWIMQTLKDDMEWDLILTLFLLFFGFFACPSYWFWMVYYWTEPVSLLRFDCFQCYIVIHLENMLMHHHLFHCHFHRIHIQREHLHDCQVHYTLIEQTPLIEDRPICTSYQRDVKRTTLCNVQQCYNEGVQHTTKCYNNGCYTGGLQHLVTTTRIYNSATTMRC